MVTVFRVGRGATAAFSLVFLATTGCSNGVVSTSNAISATAASTVTQTLLTDAPADQVLALGLSIDSIVLTDAAGKTASLLTKSVPVELSHLDAMQEPLLPPMKVPQDTYVSATITVSNPTVVYVDATTGKPVKVSATLAGATTTVTFASAITVSGNSAPLVFDLLVGQSVAISGSTVTVTPTFNVSQVALAQQPTNMNNGRTTGLIGQVVSVSGTSLVLQQPNGQQITIASDTNTQLRGVTTVAGLTAGELVSLDVMHQSNGTLLATRIELFGSAAQALLVGPVASVTGSTSFTQVVRQALGAGVSSAANASTYTINVGSSTSFGLAPQATALPSLPFTPVFSASTLKPGQNVAVLAGSVSGTTATAAAVTLAPQTVTGTVASVTTAGGFSMYTVTLPTPSALATASGVSTVTVYSYSGTQQMNNTALAVGSKARFNGLLFNDNGTLRMVAAGCSDMPGNAPSQTHR